MQRLLNAAQRDVDAVRDDLQTYGVTHLSDAGAVLVVDETGFLKKGVKSAVWRASTVARRGGSRTAKRGIPPLRVLPWAGVSRPCIVPAKGLDQEIAFASKGELAQAMLARAFVAGVPAQWVTADEVYGNDGKLRRWLPEEKRAYVHGVSRAQMIGSGETWTQERVETAIAALPAQDWQRLPVGNGSKGPRVYDWAATSGPATRRWRRSCFTALAWATSRNVAPTSRP